MAFVVCVKLVMDLSGVKVSRSSNTLHETKNRVLSEESKAALQKAAKHKTTEKIIAVGACTQEQSSLLREAAAYGADEVYGICVSETDSVTLATLLSEFCRQKEASSVFCGEKSLEHNVGEIPGRIAAELGYDISHEWKEKSVVICSGEILPPSALKIMKSAKTAVNILTPSVSSKELYLRRRIIIPEA